MQRNKLPRWIAALVGVVGGIVIVVMMLHITADVIARYFFGAPLTGTLEIVSRYYMVAVTFLPLAWVEYRNQMISVSAFDNVLPRRVLRVRDALVALISAGVFGLLAWTSGMEALEAVQKKAFVMALGQRLSIWPTYLLLPIGFAIVALVTLYRFSLIVRTGALADEIEQGDPQ